MTYIARKPGTSKTKEFEASSTSEARKQAGLYWKIRKGRQHAIAVSEKGGLI